MVRMKNNLHRYGVFKKRFIILSIFFIIFHASFYLSGFKYFMNFAWTNRRTILKLVEEGREGGVDILILEVRKFCIWWWTNELYFLLFSESLLANVSIHIIYLKKLLRPILKCLVWQNINVFDKICQLGFEWRYEYEFF